MATIHKGYWLALITILLAAAIILAVMTLPGNTNGFETSKVTVITKSGDAFVFNVEIARTPKEQGIGLASRKELPENAGMLFLNDTERVMEMWMYDTYMPLDMLFLASDGMIVDIYQDAKPESTDIISSGVPVKGVLEIGGGLAKKLSINKGDTVLHQALTANGK